MHGRTRQGLQCNHRIRCSRQSACAPSCALFLLQSFPLFPQPADTRVVRLGRKYTPLRGFQKNRPRSLWSAQQGSISCISLLHKKRVCARARLRDASAAPRH